MALWLLIPCVLCYAKSLQSCPTLCDPIDSSPPGSPVPGILQARTLQGVAIPFSMGSSPPRDQTQVSHVSCIGRHVLYYYRHLGSPRFEVGLEHLHSEHFARQWGCCPTRKHTFRSTDLKQRAEIIPSLLFVPDDQHNAWHITSTNVTNICGVNTFFPLSP